MVTEEPSVTPPQRATASPGSTPIPGCLPACVPGGLTQPGPLPPGDYTSMHWFGGQYTVTIPEVGWSSFEDSTGELGLRPPQPDGSALLFWLDIYPILDPYPIRVTSAERTVDGVFEWLEANPNLETDPRQDGVLGGLPAQSIDLRRADGAVNVDPECPAEGRPCVGMFGFEQWDGFYSQGGEFHLRIIGADVTWGGEEHAVYAVVEAPDRPALEAFTRGATEIVAGARLPAGVTP